MSTLRAGAPILNQFQLPGIVEVVRQFRKDADELAESMEELVMQYPYQWAGMFKGELTVAPSLVELLALVGEEPNVAVRYLNPNPKLLVLSLV